MKILLLLAAFAGNAYGWQQGLEYEYRYSGIVETGIPDINNQAAASVIEADVSIQVSKDIDGSAMVTIHNIKVGEFNGDVGCNFRDDIPVELRAADFGSFEEPFLVYILDQEDGTVIVAVEDEMWKMNLRKAIVSIFKNEVTTSNFATSTLKPLNEFLNQGFRVPVFSVMEETLFGVCKVDYELQKLPEYFADSRKYIIDQRITKDIQIKGATSSKSTKKSKSKSGHKYGTRSKSSSKTKSNISQEKVAELEDELWKLIRSVDFDECKEMVEFQVTPLAFRGKLASSQYEWARSRSSSSEFILRGTPGHFRVEEAEVNGGIQMAPFGSKTDMLEMNTRQTLKLLSVWTHGSTVTLSSSCIPFPSWMQQVESSAHLPKDSHGWVKYQGHVPAMRPLTMLTGQKVDYDLNKYKQDLTAKIIEQIDAAVFELSDLDQEVNSPPGTIIENLHSAAELMNSLNKKEILDIFDHYYSKDISQSDTLNHLLVVDLAASSPYPEGMEAILHMANQKKIIDSQMATVFMTLTSSLAAPKLLPTIVDYALNLDLDQQPFLTSIVWLNTAKLIKKFCNEPENSFKIPVEILGDEGICDQTLIENRVIPALKNIIDHQELAWQRTLAILTLQSLGSPLSIPILTPIVLGTTEKNRRVRISAIYGLEKWNLPSFVKEQVTLILKEVISNYGEHAEVRQSALATLLSWGVEPSYWHQLARSTWNDPSKQMVAFITSTLESFANLRSPVTDRESKVAYHALRYAKSITPSAKYSYNMVTVNNILERFITKFENIAWMSNSYDADFPSQFYYFVMTSMGGLEMNNLEFWIAADGVSDFLRVMDENYSKKDDGQGHSRISQGAKIANAFYKKIQEVVLAKPISKDSEWEVNVWIQLLENAVAYFPLNQNTVGLNTDWITATALQMTMGYDYVLAKYINPITLTSFLPSELGAPVITSTSSPMVFSKCSLTTLDTPDTGNPFGKLGLHVEILTKISTKTEGRIQVYTPWQNSIISTGVTGLRDIVLPFAMKFNGKNDDNDGTVEITMKTVTESAYLNKFKLLHASNTPFTSIGPIHPLTIIEGQEVRSTVRLPISETLKEKRIAPKLPIMANLNMEIYWKSHLQSPFSLFSMQSFEHLAGSPLLLYAIASPTVRMWELEVSLNPGENKMEFETSCATYGKKKEDFTGQTTGDDYSQQSQNSYSDYNDFQQTSHTSQDLFGGSQELESDESGEVEAEVNVGVDWNAPVNQRAERLQDKYGGTVKSCNMKVGLNGETMYESAISWSTSLNHQSHRNVNKAQLSLFRGPIEGVDPNPSTVCIDMTYASPTFSDFDTVESVLARNLNINLSAGLTLGCRGEPVISLDGSQVLSKEFVQQYLTEYTNQCDYDEYDPMFGFFNHVQYDRVKFDLKWKELCNYKNYAVTTSIIDLLEAVKLTRCVDDGNDVKELHFNADRLPSSHNWDLTLKRGNSIQFQMQTNIEHHSELDENIQFFTGVQGFSSYGEDTVSTKCVLGVDHARTFDGFTYTYTPTECWVVAVQEFLTDESGFMILIKSADDGSKVPDVRMIDLKRALVVDMTSKGVKVNGKVVDPVDHKETIKDLTGKPLGTITKQGDFFQLKLNDPEVQITLKSDVEIKLSDSFLGLTRGLCGYYDGEPEADMVGPAGCYYGNPDLLARAWSGPSDSCDIYKLLERRDEVDTYQRSCKPMKTLLEEASKNVESCMSYRVFEEMNFTCKSEPVPSCDGEHCHSFKSIETKVPLRCWNTGHYDYVPQFKTKNFAVDCRKYG